MQFNCILLFCDLTFSLCFYNINQMCMLLNFKQFNLCVSVLTFQLSDNNMILFENNKLLFSPLYTPVFVFMW
jgi:hypothetical protein